jgi:hypothetical protein
MSLPLLLGALWFANKLDKRDDGISAQLNNADGIRNRYKACLLLAQHLAEDQKPSSSNPDVL